MCACALGDACRYRGEEHAVHQAIVDAAATGRMQAAAAEKEAARISALFAAVAAGPETAAVAALRRAVDAEGSGRGRSIAETEKLVDRALEERAAEALAARAAARESHAKRRKQLDRQIVADRIASAERAKREKELRKQATAVALKAELAAKEAQRSHRAAVRKATGPQLKAELALVHNLVAKAREGASSSASSSVPTRGVVKSSKSIGVLYEIPGVEREAVDVPPNARPGFVWTDGGVVIKVNVGKHVAVQTPSVTVGWRLCSIDGKPVGAGASYDAIKMRLQAARTHSEVTQKPYHVVFEAPASSRLPSLRVPAGTTAGTAI